MNEGLGCRVQAQIGITFSDGLRMRSISEASFLGVPVVNGLNPRDHMTEHALGHLRGNACSGQERSCRPPQIVNDPRLLEVELTVQFRLMLGPGGKV